MIDQKGTESTGAGAGRDGVGGSGHAVEVKNLNKTYETRAGSVEALREANFAVERGEFVSLVGPSGCGKSTALHIVAGLLEGTSGTVTVGGSPAKAGRSDVGIMLQRAVLLPWRTVLENVLLPIEIFDLSPKETRARALELISLVGLEGFDDKYPWELSGGMQQRASLARLLVFDPQIILMDEPFAALDEFTRERLNGELARLHESLNKSVLYVTHHIMEAVFLSDRVVVMKPRPGEVLDIVDINLPRPRDVKIIGEPETAEMVTKIRRMLGFGGGDEAYDS